MAFGIITAAGLSFIAFGGYSYITRKVKFKQAMLMTVVTIILYISLKLLEKTVM